jgi:GT2 family glycosyltransferase
MMTMTDPLFSIVIPTYRRPAALRACLEGIARQDADRSCFEVIVVNDDGPVPSPALIAGFEDRLDVRVVGQANGGPGAARNLGARLAAGRFLVFIDDDCVPSASWLRALMEEFRRDPDRLLGGSVINALPANAYASASQLIMTYVYDYYERSPHAERFFTTNNFAVRADRFREMGGFDTSIAARTAEDKEFCHRWRSAGNRMACVPRAAVLHAHDLTLLDFVRQHFNYGRGILSFRRRVTRRVRAKTRPEPLSFYWNMLLYPLRRGSLRARWLTSGLVVLSQIATAAGAVRAVLADEPGLERPRPARLRMIPRVGVH